MGWIKLNIILAFIIIKKYLVCDKKIDMLIIQLDNQFLLHFNDPSDFAV